ncbi:MAG: ribosome-binding factor A [Deltaproteobacteria bacterium]|nr:ribosome-binding factor A [Deltaproteobacteria bacterium]
MGSEPGRNESGRGLNALAEKVRVQRVAEQIRGELSQILRDEVRDPRLPLLTITRVKLAVDLGAATVFYSPLGEDPDADRSEELQQVMRKVTGYVRRSLSKRVKLRHTPELRWVLDDSIAEGSHTLELIRDLDLQPGDDGDVERED